jgi:hypothetical protein
MVCKPAIRYTSREKIRRRIGIEDNEYKARKI